LKKPVTALKRSVGCDLGKTKIRSRGNQMQTRNDSEDVTLKTLAKREAQRKKGEGD